MQGINLLCRTHHEVYPRDSMPALFLRVLGNPKEPTPDNKHTLYSNRNYTPRVCAVHYKDEKKTRHRGDGKNTYCIQSTSVQSITRRSAKAIARVMVFAQEEVQKTELRMQDWIN